MRLLVSFFLNNPVYYCYLIKFQISIDLNNFKYWYQVSYRVNHTYLQQFASRAEKYYRSKSSFFNSARLWGNVKDEDFTAFIISSLSLYSTNNHSIRLEDLDKNSSLSLSSSLLSFQLLTRFHSNIWHV